MTPARVAFLGHANRYVMPALARRLTRAGYALALHEPAPGQIEALQALGAEVAEVGSGDAATGLMPSDTTAEGCRTLMAEVIDRFGRLDSAVLMPPSTGTVFTTGPFLAASTDDLAEMSSYLTVTAHQLQALIPVIARPGGQIVVFTSDAGARPAANWATYGAVRAGQSFLVQAVALEHAAEGICINAIGSKNAVFAGFPGTPPGAVDDHHVETGAWSASLEAETPLGRLGTMDELAAFTQVLVDGTNRFQTAQYFSFSGGCHLG